MNIKRIGLTILSIVSIGWLGNFLAKDIIENKIEKSKNSWIFDMSYKKYIKIPLFCTFSILFLMLFSLVYFLWCSVLGVWFTYLTLFLFPLFMFIINPLTIYLLTKETISTSIVLEETSSEQNENDVYLLKMINEEGLINA